VNSESVVSTHDSTIPGRLNELVGKGHSTDAYIWCYLDWIWINVLLNVCISPTPWSWHPPTVPWVKEVLEQAVPWWPDATNSIFTSLVSISLVSERVSWVEQHIYIHRVTYVYIYYERSLGNRNIDHVEEGAGLGVANRTIRSFRRITLKSTDFFWYLLIDRWPTWFGASTISYLPRFRKPYGFNDKNMLLWVFWHGILALEMSDLEPPLRSAQ